MTEQPSNRQALAVFLNFAPSLADFITEVLQLEGYAVHCVRTEANTWSLLDRRTGRSIVLMDTLRFHHEGQQFLLTLRTHPDVRARVRVVCMTGSGFVDELRQEYDDVLDAFLLMPFTVPQFLNALVFP